jgi:PAS domain S-box-containing protein/putative nucleotidyltransferase with HDIG domain
VTDDRKSLPIDADSEAVVVTDAAGVVVAANAAACTLLMRTEPEICALGLSRLTSMSGAHDAPISESPSASGQCVVETTLVRGDGTTFLAQLLGATIRDNGWAALTPIILRDLSAQQADQAELAEYRERFGDLLKERATEMREAAARVRLEAEERKHAEAELRASEERFRMLVECSSDLILVVDGQAKVTYCSPSVERLTGYRQDEATGMIVDELVDSADLAQIVELRHAAERLGTATGTLRIHTKSGSLRWFEWSASPRLCDGAVQGSVVNARDVTERVLAEHATQVSEKRYRTLAEASPDMIFVVGSDQRVQYVNGCASERFGCPPGAIVGRSLAELLPDGTRADGISGLSLAFTTGTPWEGETVTIFPAGEAWLQTRLVPLSDDDGRVSAVLGVAHDVTARRLAENALADSERRYRSLFEDSPVAMWEEDHSAVKAHLEGLVASGVSDVAGYLREHPQDYQDCVALVRTLAVNQAAVALCEASSRENLIAREPELYLPGALRGLPNFWEAMLAGGREATYEQAGLTLAGHKLRVIETCTVAPGHEETFDRVFVADLDVTQRRQAEELLAKYQLLATEARDIMVFVRAADGQIVEANAAAEVAYGYSRAELLQLRSQALRGDPNGPSVADHVAAAGEGSVLFETQHRRRDGSLFPVEVSSQGTVTIDGVEVRLSVIRDITERRQNESALARTTARQLATLEAAVSALGAMAELRDPYTAGHQRRVAELSCAIAAELGWSAQRIAALRTGALLHDLGKIVVPAEILAKPGRLSEAEFTLIRQHAASGAEILADIDFDGEVAAMALQHHERLDGSGYPAGLKDEEILPEARVLAVADVVEAMVSHRPYRPALSLESALAEIEQGSGSRYDAEVGAACMRLLREQRFVL